MRAASFFLLAAISGSFSQQIPLSPVMSPSTEFVRPGGPTLLDALTLQRSCSIFYDYLRDVPGILESLSERPSTVFVPKNTAVIGLARKPHLGPVGDQVEVMSGQEYDERARGHVKRWISAHVVPAHPIELAGSHSTLLDGRSITFGGDGTWESATLEGGVKILNKVEASNGVLYIIDGTIVP